MRRFLILFWAGLAFLALVELCGPHAQMWKRLDGLGERPKRATGRRR